MILCWSNLGWTFLNYFWVGLNKTREVTTVLLVVSKNFSIDVHLDVPWNRFKLLVTLLTLFYRIYLWFVDQFARHDWTLQYDSSWMTLTFSHGYQCMRKLEHSVAKLHEAAQMFRMVDHAREMTSKKSCKSGKYGAVEHLLFLFIAVNLTLSVLTSRYPDILCTTLLYWYLHIWFW